MKKIAKTQSKLMLAPKHLALVRAVLRTHASHHRAYVFGSRVVSNAADRTRLKPHSDLNILLEGPRLKLHEAYALKEAFSESDLPMRVDTVNWMICRASGMFGSGRFDSLSARFKPSHVAIYDSMATP